MPLDPRRRRRIDRLVAAALAVLVVAVGAWLYLRSDVRATTDSVGPSEDAPSAVSSAPTALTQAWSQPTDAAVGSAVSPFGIVVTTTTHDVIGRDASTGVQRWSYSRANRNLCAVANADQSAQDSKSGPYGIYTVFEENGYCSQVMTLDPTVGSRLVDRTSPNQVGGSLVIGGPYSAWVGSDLLEVWRWDLLRTAQYGVQPNPTEPQTQHTGCTFDDFAVADTQYATVEHCTGNAHAMIVLNFTDPGCSSCNYTKGWDVFKFKARMSVDTGVDDARIVGLTADRVAVLVGGSSPAVVVYDAAGQQVARTPVDIPDSAIAATGGPGQVTPSVTFLDQRLSLIGGQYLVSVTSSEIQTTAPATTLVPSTSSSSTPASSATASSAPASNLLDIPTSSAAPQVKLQTLTVGWTMRGVLGLPAQVGNDLLVPVTNGLKSVDATSGAAPDGSQASVLPVNRAGYRGRVDASAVGQMIIESRGGTVVALRST